MVANTLMNIITSNRMTDTKQPVLILMMTNKIGGAVKHLMGIGKPFRDDTENWTDPTIQATIVHFKKAIRMRHSDWNHFILGILNSGIDVPIFGRNIDN